jgi:glucose/arabinose dehydrogenase
MLRHYPTLLGTFVFGIGAFQVAAGQVTPSAAPDIEKGKVIFSQRCALCHAPDASGTGQGPALKGVVGRAAASASEFPYTAELRRAQLTWDEKTLDRFLANPMLVAPGTAMPIGLPQTNERRDVIAYLATLSPGGAEAIAAKSAAATDPGHWRNDVPGRRYRIDVSALPAPYASSSVANFPRSGKPSVDSRLAVPNGFIVQPFATQLTGPRTIRVAPNGDIFVAETRAGRITVLRAVDGTTELLSTQVFASGLKQPFGIAFYPLDSEPRWVYVATINSVVRFPYRNGDLQARGRAQVVVAQLSPTSGGHTTRDIAFSKDGQRMFISVGSASNVGEGMSSKSADELKQWQATKPIGAAWGSEANRATVLTFTPEGKSEKIFATGIRNCVGMSVAPASGDLWCAVNERDALGDDLVPDYVTRVREAAFFGWPWYYIGKNEDPRLAKARPDLADKVTVPDVLIQAHSAPMHLAFYEQSAGVSVFPIDYRGDAFVTLHGSWNRGQRTGYKVVRIRMNAGVPTGEYEDFLTGLVSDDRHVWGRPVGIAVARDGALLLSDDVGDMLWRVSPHK